MGITAPRSTSKNRPPRRESREPLGLSGKPGSADGISRGIRLVTCYLLEVTRSRQFWMPRRVAERAVVFAAAAPRRPSCAVLRLRWLDQGAVLLRQFAGLGPRLRLQDPDLARSKPGGHL